MTTTTPNYLNFAQLSTKLAGRSESSIRRDIANGLLPEPLKLNRALLFDEAQVDAYLKRANQPELPPFENAEARRLAAREVLQAKSALEARVEEHRHAINDIELEIADCSDQMENILSTPLAGERRREPAPERHQEPLPETRASFTPGPAASADDTRAPFTLVN